MRFAKGHGTGNDFLILDGQDGAAALSPDLVARLCDRRTGLGADGILRIAPAGEAVGGGYGTAGPPGPDARSGPAGAGASGPPAQWFMDYRNADGSVAEMCGNGIRVFARYLIDHGLATGPEFDVATRAGVRRVREETDGNITVDMGVPAIGGRSSAVIGSSTYEGLEVSLGNPHLACLVDLPVAELELSVPPVIDRRRFPEGANVEVVRVLEDRRLDMRVHERGSGVTLSCGTGAVAAAVAAAVADGPGPGAASAVPAGTWTVRVPGGDLVVTLTGSASLLTGPAVIVAEGTVDEAWLSGAAGAVPHASHV